jgi:hypothetical protein
VLDTLISAFKGFFSRGFWLGNFLPVGMFAALHLVIAAVQFPTAVPLVTWIASDQGAAVKIAPIAIAGLVVLAYSLAPLVPMFRGIFDGTLLPPKLHEMLRRERLDDARRGRDQLENATDIADRWEDLADRLNTRVKVARAAGAQSPHPTTAAAVEHVATRVREFQAAFRDGGLPGVALTEQVTVALETALRARNYTLPFDTVPGGELARRMTRLQGQFAAGLRDVVRETRYLSDSLFERFADTALDHFRASRIGDERERSESYSKRVYRADFEFLWPRLRISIAKDDPLTDQLADAGALIDFAVLSLALSVTVPLAWLPVLAFTAEQPWLFFVVGFASPVAIAFVNQLLLRSQISFGTVVETAVDKYRLDVLTKMLHQPLPATRADERELWNGLRIAADTEDDRHLNYRHVST